MSSLSVRFLLLSILTITLSCSAAPPPVYDMDGQELSADASYYVLPVTRGQGGGLTLAPNGLPCPLFVAQEAVELRRGLPVRITPLGGGAAAAPSDRTVRLSTDVRIRFDAATTCVQTTAWHVEGESLSGARQHVVTGPVRKPSPSGREYAFRVERYGVAKANSYKLVSCRDSCKDLGVFREGKEAAWLLGAREAAHAVRFKKAPPV